MGKAQIKEAFQEAHKNQLLIIAAAQFKVMDAQAELQAYRKTMREIEAKFREDMANATEGTQTELPLNDVKKK